MHKCTDDWLLSLQIKYLAFAADATFPNQLHDAILCLFAAAARNRVLVWCFDGGSFCRRQFKINLLAGSWHILAKVSKYYQHHM